MKNNNNNNKYKYKTIQKDGAFNAAITSRQNRREICFYTRIFCTIGNYWPQVDSACCLVNMSARVGSQFETPDRLNLLLTGGLSLVFKCLCAPSLHSIMGCSNRLTPIFLFQKKIPMFGSRCFPWTKYVSM